ncbi:MAG: UPF0149 family protein [Stenotrophobium sp.]
MEPAITYDDLQQTLVRLDYDEDAAGYHGALCGALCVIAPAEINFQDLLAPGEQTINVPDSASRRLLQRLMDQSLHSLQDDEKGFTPLLPDDEAMLAARVQALSAWCEGFLFGLASRPRFDIKTCSEEAREIIHDFTQFTHASIAQEDDAEIEETAYAELVEYIRVGAQLIYMELRCRPTPDPAASARLH